MDLSEQFEIKPNSYISISLNHCNFVKDEIKDLECKNDWINWGSSWWNDK